jgi:acyl carrier protein
MSDIASRVKAIIVDKLGVDENEVVTEASFTNDLELTQTLLSLLWNSKRI